MAKGNSQKKANGSTLQFEAQLWAAAEQAVPAPNYPPFNMSDWGGENLRQDERWDFRLPPVNNANYAWIQHFIHHLSPLGAAQSDSRTTVCTPAHQLTGN
jgi:type I restriction-modification system DNA methylase subunit